MSTEIEGPLADNRQATNEWRATSAASGIEDLRRPLANRASDLSGNAGHPVFGARGGVDSTEGTGPEAERDSADSE